MKKVLLIAYACSPDMGSEENVGWNWVTGLSVKGYEVWCLTNTEGQSSIEKLKKNPPNMRMRFQHIALPFGFDGLLLNPSSKSIYLHYWLWKIQASEVAFLLHQKECFDVAHHVTYGSLQQGSCFNKLDGCKIIFGPVGGGQMARPIFRDYFEEKWIWEVIRKKVSNLLMRYSTSLKGTLKQSTTILVANRETKSLLSSSYPMFSKKTYLTTDIALPRQYEKNTEPIKTADEHLKILWLGKLISRKGLKLSLDAIGRVNSNVRYKLTIVGDGEQKAKIAQWVKEFDLNPLHINCVGTVPFNELKQYYSDADVLLFCSLRDTTGSQILEAMAFGLPVIVFDSSGAGYFVPENCGIKINPSTKEATVNNVARAIEKLYDDEEFRLEMGINAYNYAMKNTWINKIDLITNKFY